MSEPSCITVSSGPLRIKAYRGDGCVLIAMDLPSDVCAGLAGFAIARSPDGRTFAYVPNRLGFDTASQPEVTQPSSTAPFQKFRWVDYPPEDSVASYTYRVEARYFSGGVPSDVRYAATFSMTLTGDAYPNFLLGFTRGYVSSQAFADRYPAVRALRPDNSVDYDTDAAIPKTNPAVTWRELYEWLGAGARRLLSSFTEECKQDGHGFDVFAYDLDEPDFIKFVAQAAEAKMPVRMILDDAPLHTKKTAREVESAALLQKAGVKLLRGHFKRYAHSKCVIERDADGNAVRVLTGSANFSVRGLYVQSNSVIVVNDPEAAKLYGEAFDQAWSDMAQFADAEIASEWFDAQGGGIPAFSVSFAPHKTGEVSLGRVAAAIRNAKSSVLFAVMELAGGGAVMQELTTLQQRHDIFSYGVTQTTKGIKFYKGGGANGLLVPFSYLKAHVPEPFRAEWNGGMGQVIHHKFVVIDFNDANPIVYCGSSNLAEGGEQSNGDNLLEIRDTAIATQYAVEAIQLVDHYEFRAVEANASSAAPLVLQGPGSAAPWWQSSYDPSKINYTERILLSS